MKIQILQFEVAYNDFEKNINKIETLFHSIHTDTDVVVLPEMWNTGYALNTLSQSADQMLKASYPLIANLAKQYDVNIIAGSVSNKREDGIYNTAFAVNREGILLHETDKVHLVPMLDEQHYLQGAKQLPNHFTMDGIKMGQIICYDLRFPEVMRQPIKQGAQLMFVVAEWTSMHAVHWTKLLQARAIENSCFIIGCNAIGPIQTKPGVNYCGQSQVVNPYGEVISALQEEEGILTVEINPMDVIAERNKIPVIDNIRNDLY